MKLKALYAAIFRSEPDTMPVWYECYACGYREVMRQPCSIDACSKCGKLDCMAERGTKPPVWWEEQ